MFGLVGWVFLSLSSSPLGNRCLSTDGREILQCSEMDSSADGPEILQYSEMDVYLLTDQRYYSEVKWMPLF